MAGGQVPAGVRQLQACGLGVLELRRTGDEAEGEVLTIDGAVLETEIGDEEEQMGMVRATSGVGDAAAPPVPHHASARSRWWRWRRGPAEWC